MTFDLIQLINVIFSNVNSQTFNQFVKIENFDDTLIIMMKIDMINFVISYTKNFRF